MAVYRGDDLVSANMQMMLCFMVSIFCFGFNSNSVAPLCGTFCLRIFSHASLQAISSLRIVLVEAIMGALVQLTKMTTFQGLLVLSIFPLSLVLVATLEAFGLD